MKISNMDFATIRAARQLMTDLEATVAFEIAVEAERGNLAAEVAFWQFIREILGDAKRRQLTLPINGEPK